MTAPVAGGVVSPVEAAQASGLVERLASDELRVALSPSRAYERLVGVAGGADGATLSNAAVARGPLARMATVLLLYGIVGSTIATGRIRFDLLAIVAASFSFVLVMQLFAALVLMASAPAAARRVSRTRALDLWFAGHLPYSLWLMAMGAWILVIRSLPPLASVPLILVPAIWTWVIGRAFCAVVLGNGATGARWRLAGHQVIVWSAMALYLLSAAGGSAGMTSYVERWFASGS
jgi:hypothetical protein